MKRKLIEVTWPESQNYLDEDGIIDQGEGTVLVPEDSYKHPDNYYSFTVNTTDPKETKRAAKSTDMAIAIFNMVHNLPRDVRKQRIEIKPDESEGDAILRRMRELLEENSIDVDELID